MRIVIDLQACQNAGSRFRGIGRYSRSLALAMVNEGRGHDYWLALNGGLPEAIEEIRASFDGLVPQEQIVVWDNPFPSAAHVPGDPWKCRVAEVLREDFLKALRPDVVHLASLFEGWGDAVTTSIGRGSGSGVPTAVTLYDLIPMTMSELYLPDPRSRRWYDRKLEDLRRADLCLAISDYTRDEAVELLDLSPGQVVNISGSTDPLFRRLPQQVDRSGALAARYGVWRPFVMYTGGFDPRKNVAGLIRAYAALPGVDRERRQLVIVGKPPAEVLSELMAIATSCGLSGDEIRFVGFVPDDDLVGLYNACELYVFPSRCEGFGLPALEAMACGAPVIGADASSLPEVIGYPEAMFDPHSDSAMSAKMHQALTDPAFRERLLEHGAERVQVFSWQRSARTALDAIESVCGNRSPASTATAMPPSPEAALEQRWQDLAEQSEALSKQLQGRNLDENSLRRLAAAQSENYPVPGRRRQLIVDVSNISQQDAHTGIQRVVRNILRELLQVPLPGMDVVPVWFDDGVLRHARGFVHRLLGRDGAAGKDDLLDAAPGDVFLGLDLSAHIVPHHRELYERLRRRGVAIHFVVYDLIPLLRPDCINPDSLQLLWAWFKAIGELSDGLCCISAAVADELAEWCDQARPPRCRPLNIGYFHLGAELDASNVAENAQAPEFLGGRSSFLMVGTIEPRKGHRQAVAAFEQLWSEGRDVNLVIVGKPGWLVDDLLDKLRTHPEAGVRLHWLADADDEILERLYQHCSALVAASEEEGFGLPLVEAACRGLPVIARDRPVFREVAGDNAFYFHGYEAEDLSGAIKRWLALDAQGSAPDSRGMRCLGWAQSARGLLDLVLGNRWRRSWMPGSRYWLPVRHELLRRQVGRFERKHLVSDGDAGFLNYGPYIPIPAGRYRLRVWGHWNAQTGAPPWVEVINGQGRTRSLHAELVPGHVVGEGLLFDQAFLLEADAPDLEIRLWVGVETRISLRALELVGETDIP